jgi:hypothetical protein
MADVDANIVPFGKYKGQPVEAMMADPSYCAWAMSQPGLRTRFSSLFTIIVSGGVAPDTPTPEHNRMQLLFRNPDMRLAAYRSISGEEAFDQVVSEEASNRSRAELTRQAILAGDAAAIAVLDDEVAAGRFKPDKPFQRSKLEYRKDGDRIWRCPEALNDLFDGWQSRKFWDCEYDYSTGKTEEQKAEDYARLSAAEAYRKAAKQRVVAYACDAADSRLKKMLEIGEDQRVAAAARRQILEEVRQSESRVRVSWLGCLPGWASTHPGEFRARAQTASRRRLSSHPAHDEDAQDRERQL